MDLLGTLVRRLNRMMEVIDALMCLAGGAVKSCGILGNGPNFVADLCARLRTVGFFDCCLAGGPARR